MCSCDGHYKCLHHHLIAYRSPMYGTPRYEKAMADFEVLSENRRRWKAYQTSSREGDIEVYVDEVEVSVLAHGKLNAGPDKGLLVIHCTTATPDRVARVPASGNRDGSDA